MSNTTFLKSRRSFLKVAAYTSALSIGGLSTLAFASKREKNIFADSSISIMQQQMLDRETVTLINHSDNPILLDSLKPVHLEQVNGSLMVKVNQINPNTDTFGGLVQISPSERITFDITTLRADFSNAEIFPIPTLTGNDVQLSSNHSAFNLMLAVS